MARTEWSFGVPKEQIPFLLGEVITAKSLSRDLTESYRRRQRCGRAETVLPKCNGCCRFALVGVLVGPARLRGTYSREGHYAARPGTILG